MTKERFERLRESVIEAGQVLRGERKPSREFTYQIVVSQRGKALNSNGPFA